jgi:hypothetical protein
MGPGRLPEGIGGWTSGGRVANGREELGAEVAPTEDVGRAFSLSVSCDDGADSVGAMGSDEGMGITKPEPVVRVAGGSGILGTGNSVCAI